MMIFMLRKTASCFLLRKKYVWCCLKFYLARRDRGSKLRSFVIDFVNNAFSWTFQVVDNVFVSCFRVISNVCDLYKVQMLCILVFVQEDRIYSYSQFTSQCSPLPIWWFGSVVLSRTYCFMLQHVLLSQVSVLYLLFAPLLTWTLSCLLLPEDLTILSPVLPCLADSISIDFCPSMSA